MLNEDTVRRAQSEQFQKWFESEGNKQWTVERCWAVDTCQMWLAGWGRCLELDASPDTRIVLVPGDLDEVTSDFFKHLLPNFVAANDHDVILGDYQVPPGSPKDLIDVFGTRPLLANWFPEVYRFTAREQIVRPRTEFLNIRFGVLETILVKRKFAYEQTLNMLIALTEQPRDVRSVGAHKLGLLTDAPRGFLECMIQIERTERMLKLIWRERSGQVLFNEDTMNDFEQRDRRSTAIRQNAMVTLRVMLDNPEETTPTRG